MYQRQEEEVEPSQEEVASPQPQLRRSTRVRKSNPKYANAAEDASLKEPETYDEAARNPDWTKKKFLH